MTTTIDAAGTAVVPQAGNMVTAPPQAALPWGGAAGGLFKNLETFPGQILYTPPKLSAAQEGKMSRADIVRAARHAERTSEHIRGGLDRKADMTIGATLRVHARPDWATLGLDGKEYWDIQKPFEQAAQRLFNNWAYDSRLLQDAEGHYNFGGLMWMAFRNVQGPDAECCGVIHYDQERADRYNTPWATYVQLVDPDRLSTPSDLKDPENVYEGKRLDKAGRCIGMYIANRHPSEGVTTIEEMNHTYVPRETWWGRAMSFHWFVKTRAGQHRGVSAMVTILKKTGMLDSFDDAYLGAAIVNQVLANYIETMASPETVAEQLAPVGKTGVSPFDLKTDFYGKAKIRIGGARVPVLPPGDKIVMNAVNRAIGDPSQFRNGFLREFASALGLTFEQVSGNFSDANYSAARAALLEVWRGIMSLRKMFTAHVATLIYAAVIEEAIGKGWLVLPPGAPPFQENRAAYTGCMWTGPGMGWIDPQKEANAIETMLRIKLKSRATAAAEMDGSDYLDTFNQIEQERLEAGERGFDLDPAAPGTPGADGTAVNDNDEKEEGEE